jgi:tRNA G18 (ribose-2'-O)-methylase SpoU
VGPVHEIDDADDPRLRDYHSLTDVALRRLLEPAGGLFIAEGALVIERAVAAGYRLRSVLTAAEWLDRLGPALRGSDAPVYVASRAMLEAVTGFHVHRGALASVHRRPLPEPAAVLAGASRVVVLEDMVSHTNLGAVFRSAAALGMDAVLLSPSCADPLYRRSVRVSMGQVFAVPYARLARWPQAIDDLRAAGHRVLALTPAPDATALDHVRLGADERVALLLGTEGPGLSGRAIAAADEVVRIPMAAGVDSLNVAAAAAVAFWVVGRR